jgi:hypothetical protein
MCSRLWGITPGVAVAWTLVFSAAAHWLASDACFGQPPPRQIAVRISGELFAPQIEQPIDQVLPVHELILGVRATGEAHVTGQPKLILADDADEAAFSVEIDGLVESRTIGSKGPVRIHSRSQTRFVATKRVAYRPGRGFVAEPASIQAQTDNQTDRIEPFCKGSLGRMIERQAWARVAQSQDQVERLVQAKAEGKIREAFDRLLDQRLARLNRMADQRYLVAAVLGGSELPVYRGSTRDGSLIIVATSSEPAEVAETSATFDRGRQGPPLQIWVHEAVVGERIAALLWGTNLARRLFDNPTATDADISSTRGSYDFATDGEWIVVHSGEWNRPAATVARTDGDDAAARLAVGGGQ